VPSDPSPRAVPVAFGARTFILRAADAERRHIGPPLAWRAKETADAVA
jgi:hypothetical protein